MFRINEFFAWLLLPCIAALFGCAPGPAALPKGFVTLADVDASIGQSMVYAGPDNFVGTRVDGYGAGRCVLTEEAAQALAAVQRQAKARGLSLIVFDCYRPQQAVDHFVRWSQAPGEETKASFYPNVEKARLFEEGYIAQRSGHSRGSTVDVGLVPAAQAEASLTLTKPEGDCTSDVQAPVLDFGTRFDCFDTRSHTADPRISAQAKANRAALLALMEEAGWANYAQEWWHFTLKNEPFPDQYFDFPITAE